jgi:replicative DNA helicase
VDGKDLGMLVIDYMQLMSGTQRSESRVQEVSQISRGLKALARELNVPVVALSQLSRGPEARTDKRPMLSDLRDSGSIEQDADTVMFLYRPEYYAPPEKRDELKGKSELIIGKQRNGPTGVVELYFQKAYTRFDSVSRTSGGATPDPERSTSSP